MIKTKKNIEYPRHWWFSTSKMTCYVESDDQDIVTKNSASIVRRFTGQHIKNLVGWLKKQGGFMYQEYTKDRKKIWQ